jgi:hypothetical protein
MTWDILLMKAPEDAVIRSDVPEGYGNLGKVADVVERLRSVIPKVWFDASGTIPTAWFTTDDIWGGVDCNAYSLRIYFHTSERELEPLDPLTPVRATDTVEQVYLAFQRGRDPRDTNPYCDDPVWDFIAAACRALECRAEDDARFLGPDGRPIPVPEPKRPWWQFWR